MERKCGIRYAGYIVCGVYYFACQEHIAPIERTSGNKGFTGACERRTRNTLYAIQDGRINRGGKNRNIARI